MPERRLRRTRAAYPDENPIAAVEEMVRRYDRAYVASLHPDGSGRQWCPRCLVFVAPGHDCPFLEHDQWGV